MSNVMLRRNMEKGGKGNGIKGVPNVPLGASLEREKSVELKGKKAMFQMFRVFFKYGQPRSRGPLLYIASRMSNVKREKLAGRIMLKKLEHWNIH